MEVYMLKQERLKELLHYDPDAGIFTRRVAVNTSLRIGSAAGCKTKRGYVLICVDHVSYKAHRLAWLYVHGAWPKQRIDHIDGNPSNNRISNLRDVSNSVNQQNQRRPRSNNKTGYLGVCYHKHVKKFVAAITIGGVRKSLGCFETGELASAAYLAEKRVLHAGCGI